LLTLLFWEWLLVIEDSTRGTLASTLSSLPSHTLDKSLAARKTDICLRFVLTRLSGVVFSHSLERGRLYAREKPNYSSFGEIGEEPHLGSIAVQQRSGIAGIVPADNFPSPGSTGGQIK
jgi:hypothetical protein